MLPLTTQERAPDWFVTPDGTPRGYIQPARLEELWFHTGAMCNLKCPFCLEGSHPGDRRLDLVTFDDVRPIMDAAVELDVERFSFTGGEPFVNRDMIRILDHALALRPCLVLTNGTEPLRKRMPEVAALVNRPHPLRFRVSIDYPDPERHDAGRGAGNFSLAVGSVARLHDMGFKVSIARLGEPQENPEEVNAAYRPRLEKAGAPLDAHFVVFPDFLPPGAHPGDVPHITENCMTTYHTAETRARFMCNYSKMIVKKDGRMRVYACTLVDDDEDYDLGPDLAQSMKERIMLKHHRCFSCFACGASCSET